MSTTSSTRATPTSNEAPPSHVINFGCGHPDDALLPVQQIASATQQALLATPGREQQQWLQYGRENGNLTARKALAKFLSSTLYKSAEKEEEREEVDPDTLCITSGVSHGIQLVCQTLHRMYQRLEQQEQGNKNDKATKNVPPLCWVEDPTYFLVPAILQQSGFEIQAVRTQQHGMDLVALEKQIKVARTFHPDRLLVLYCIPTHHNPLGVSLTQATRLGLIQLCETHHVYLIADEVYHGVTFPLVVSDGNNTTLTAQQKQQQQQQQQQLTAMITLSSKSSQYVISVSAFTKILCPGIRCGWIQTRNQALLQRIGQDGVLDSGGCTSQLSSGIVTALIQNGQLAAYLTSTLQPEYAQRCRHLCQCLRAVGTKYPFSFEFTEPRGGYFVWVQLIGAAKSIPPLDDAAFQSFCVSQYHVQFKSGRSCSTSSSFLSERFAYSMRLCFAYYDIPTLTLGVDRLCQAIHTYGTRTTTMD
eukprot:scaffold34706_cov165-Amphora_coffeaeformis.AAC.1